jgi:glucose 1-dehydrogenase
MKLSGKVALVTGSSQGIGQAIAIRLATEGAKVVINYRSNPDGAAETLSKVESAGGDCHMAGYSIKADYITGSTFFVDGGLLWNYQEQ